MRETEKEQLTIQIMDNKKLALLELIKTKINSFVKWDLVKFFGMVKK
jgi:hypothetical protein